MCPRDAYVEQAKTEIEYLFNKNQTLIAYGRQLEVRFEKKYFHWVVTTALSQLREERVLGCEMAEVFEGSNANFYFHPSRRYTKRIIKKKAALLRRYAEAAFNFEIGHHAELLFLAALAARDFVCKGRNTKAYDGLEWTDTEHNLDFILEKSSIPFGCELKNTLDYIPSDELQIKLSICAHLRLRPLFILRHAPKTYIEQIRRAGGYTMIFDIQVWPRGHDTLLEEIKAEFDLPLDSPRAIPAGITARFDKWLIATGLIPPPP